MSRVIVPTSFLRRVLRADAVVSAVVGLVMAAGAVPIERLTGLPAPLLLPAGLALFPYAAWLAWLAARAAVPAWAVAVPIALNVLWAINCAWLALAGGAGLQTLGFAFLTVQAATVLLFAELEFTGLRRAGPRPV